MKTKLNILMLEDSPTDAELTERQLQKGDIEFISQRVETRDAFIRALAEFHPDIVLSDYKLPDFDGLAALKMVQRDYPHIPTIIITGVLADIEAAALLKAGARDYILKDRLARLPDAIRHVMSVEQEIRARKEAESKLIEQEYQYHTMADSGQALIWTSDTDKLCNYFNQPWLRFTGRTLEQELGNGWAEGVHPEDFAQCLATYVAAFDRREPFSMDYRLRRHDGEYRWIQDDGCPRYDIRGEFIGYIGHCLDITEHKQAEQKLRASLAEQTVMMREIHHRVKNNLQMMSALLELQSAYVKDEVALAYFRDSQQRIQSLAMIHEQLYHNKSFAQIDFTAYLHSLIDYLCGQYGKLSRQVNIRIDAMPCTLPMDTAVPCGLVLNELFSNALKHAFPDSRSGEICFSLRCGDDDKIVLEVSDNGVGLPPGLDIHRSQSFGLKIVSLMSEKQMNGKLTVESNKPGTRIVCEIGVQK